MVRRQRRDHPVSPPRRNDKLLLHLKKLKQEEPAHRYLFRIKLEYDRVHRRIMTAFKERPLLDLIPSTCLVLVMEQPIFCVSGLHSLHACK
jgi:hypothetical protein